MKCVEKTFNHMILVLIAEFIECLEWTRRVEICSQAETQGIKQKICISKQCMGPIW